MTWVRHRKGQNVNRDHSDGLSVREAWSRLFLENERSRKEKRLDDLMNDEELIQAMQRMFPDRWESCLMYQVPRVRAAFNRRRKGGWFKGFGGRFRAKRYTRVGGKAYIASAHGKPEIFLGICKMGLDDENEKGKNAER